MHTSRDTYSIVTIAEPDQISVECRSSAVRRAVRELGGRREMFTWPDCLEPMFILLAGTPHRWSEFNIFLRKWEIRIAETDAAMGAALTRLRDAGAVFAYDPKQYQSPHEVFESLRAKGIVSGPYRQIAYGDTPTRPIVSEK